MSRSTELIAKINKLSENTEERHTRSSIILDELFKTVVRAGKKVKKLVCPFNQVNKGGKCVYPTKQELKNRKLGQKNRRKKERITDKEQAKINKKRQKSVDKFNKFKVKPKKEDPKSLMAKVKKMTKSDKDIDPDLMSLDTSKEGT